MIIDREQERARPNSTDLLFLFSPIIIVNDTLEFKINICNNFVNFILWHYSEAII